MNVKPQGRDMQPATCHLNLVEVRNRSTLHVERDRVDLVARRDGHVAAVAYARRCRNIYRAAVLNKRHHASRGLYRRRFIESYLSFKRIATHYIEQPSLVTENVSHN